MIHDNIIEQNRRLSSAWNFPGYCLARSCGVMLHGFFFGFSRNLSIFKAKTAKTRKRKLFCRQIQAFFFSKLSLVFFLFQSWRVLYKNQSTCSKRPAAQNASGMPCLVEPALFATKRWLFAAKMYRTYGKKISMHLSRYEKSIAYKQIFQNFPTLCAIMRFFVIMRIIRSELNYAISHRCIIPEGLYNYKTLQIQTYSFYAG